MIIGIMTQYYPPDPQWIPAGVAQGLRDRGHEVRVLTTFPHYETGRIAHGFRQQWKDESVRGGITLRRVPIFPSHSRNPIGRVLNYLSFVWSAHLARSFVATCDVIYIYSTPMTVAAAPRVWHRRWGVPFVLHIQDLWPESVTGSGLLPSALNAGAERMLNAWLAGIYRDASAVIPIAPTMHRILEERGVDASRSHVVLNWANEDDREDAAPHPPRAGTGLSLVYAGNLGSMQEVDRIIEAVALVGDLDGLRLTVAGSGVEEAALRGLASRLAPDHITFVGRLSLKETAALLARCDFQLVTLKKLRVFEGTLPSKFTSGLLHGVPVITNVAGDVSDMVMSGGLGFVAAPDDTESLAEAMRNAYMSSTAERAAMSENARCFYATHMSRQAGVSAIEAILVEAARPRGVSHP